MSVVVGSYFFVLLAGFVINLGRAPGLLDRENAAVVFDLAAKLKTEESANVLHSKFAALMNEGRVVSKKISRIPESDLGSWIKECEDWKKRDGQALTDIGFPTDASAFMHSAEKAIPIVGVRDDRSMRDLYRREMTCYPDQLQTIIERRLP